MQLHVYKQDTYFLYYVTESLCGILEKGKKKCFSETTNEGFPFAPAQK